MQFLRTLMWVAIAVFLAILGTRNWHDVTLNLWADLQADIKLPLLLAIVFLLGLIPTFIIQRARIWSLRRRLEASERNRLTAVPVTTEPAIPSDVRADAE